MSRIPLPLWYLLKIEFPVYLSRTTSYARACVKPEYKKEYAQRESQTLLDAHVKLRTGKTNLPPEMAKYLSRNRVVDYEKDPVMTEELATHLITRGHL